jgi:hypothetical protein
VHRQELAEARVSVFAIDELESRRRLHIRHVQVGQVCDAGQDLTDVYTLLDR